MLFLVTGILLEKFDFYVNFYLKRAGYLNFGLLATNNLS